MAADTKPKNKARPLGRLASLKSRAAFLRNSFRNREMNPTLVSLALQKGEPVIPVGGFKWGGKVIKAGEPFAPAPEEWGRVLILARDHRVVTQAEYNAGAELQKLKPVLTRTERTEQQLTGYIREKGEAGARLANLQAQISGAESDLQAAESNLRRTENELEKMLDELGVE